MTTSLVHLENGHAVTTSLQIAEIFDRQHKNILQSIEYLMSQLDQNFNALNFQPVKYIDGKGETRTQYNLTRDAFVLLVMGFTGSKALGFKLAYLNAFNQMESALNQGNVQREQLIDDLKDKVVQQSLRYRQVYRYLGKGLSQVEIARCMQISTRAVRLILAEMRELELLPDQQTFVFMHTGRIARNGSTQLGLGV